jgi:N-acetylmuramic acid 6-phosphate etherase
MTAASTSRTTPIDQLPPPEALAAMLASQVAAAQIVAQALPAIEAAAVKVATALGLGHRLTYAAAGSSGLMALADGCELPGTFRIPQSQIRIAMAGGVPSDGIMPGDTEDDTASAQAVTADMTPDDVVIVLSASGTTPYALVVAQTARARGACVVAIANQPGSALLSLADIAICLPTAPEVVSGSTRLGAGTAQKIALNMMSTLAGVLLGHVHDGLMVNLNPDNIKLRKRAAAIVMQITGAADHEAEAALVQAGYDTKQAVLIASGASADAAQRLLAAHHYRLRGCLAALHAAPD